MKSVFDILIIDDENVVVESIQKIAHFNNYSSDFTLDGLEALEKLKSSEYKIIICDIMMPQMNGFQFLETLNNIGIRTPVIMTTGFSTLENAVRSLYEGAVGFIPKPFSVDELTSIIVRGINYNNLLKRIHDSINSPQTNLIIYVPCPPKYYRLGYDSWLKIDSEGTITLGITDLYIKSIGSLNAIELLNIDESLGQGSSCAKIISNNNLVHQLLAAISGKIIDVNSKVIGNANLIEKDPYFEGWLYKIIPNNLEYELKNLTSCSSDRV